MRSLIRSASDAASSRRSSGHARRHARQAKALLGLLLMVVLSGCDLTSSTGLEPSEDDPRLTANVFAVSDSVWKANVSASAPLVGDSQVRGVDSARIDVLRDGVVVDRMERVRSDQYTTYYRSTQGTRPEPGVSYTVRVSAPGYDTIEATDTVPLPTPVASTRIDESFRVDSQGTPVARFSAVLDDPKEDANYYEVVVYELWPRSDGGYQRFVASTTYDTNANIQKDVFVDPDALLGGDYDREFPIYQNFVFDDTFFDGTRYTLTIDIPMSDVASGPKLFVVSSVSEAYYRYVYTNRLQQATDENPFAEPVRVYNNFANGYGVLGGASVIATDTLDAR